MNFSVLFCPTPPQSTSTTAADSPTAKLAYCLPILPLFQLRSSSTGANKKAMWISTVLLRPSISAWKSPGSPQLPKCPCAPFTTSKIRRVREVTHSSGERKQGMVQARQQFKQTLQQRSAQTLPDKDLQGAFWHAH